MNSSRLPQGLPSNERDFVAELKAPAPRKVSRALRRAVLRQIGFRVSFWACMFMGTFGSCFVVALVPWGFWHDRRLSDAPSTEGRIISASETNPGTDDEKVWEYFFEYRPTPASVLRAECFTTGRRWEAGSQVRVRFLAGEGLAVVEGARTTERSWPRTFELLFTLLFPGVGFGLAAFIWLSRRQTEFVLANGRLMEAKVLAVDTLGGYQPDFKISLAAGDAHTPLSLSLRCTSPALVVFAETRLKSGETVCVLYHPSFPKWIVLPESL